MSFEQKQIQELFDFVQGFLDNNPSIIISCSDKGKLAVIYTVDFYNKLLADHLNNPVVYEQVSSSSNLGYIKRNKVLLLRLVENNFLNKDNILRILSSETQHPRMYGLIRTHKDNSMRPVMSCLNNPGTYIATVLLKILNKFDALNTFSLRNSLDLIDSLKTLDKTLIKGKHRLFTMDIKNMFTNISPSFALRVILPQVSLVSNIDIGLFKDMYLFVTQHATEFLANDSVFKQKSGLPMGCKISPVIASISLSYISYFVFEAEIIYT